MKDARMTILERVNIEIERTDLQESIALLEKQIKRLSGDIEDAQSEYDNLSDSGMKGFFLGLTGKKETRLQEMQNNIRKLRSELVSAEFEVNSAKARIEEIVKEVKNTQESFQECMMLYEKENGVEAIKELRTILELPTICKEIEKIFPEIKPLVTNAADIMSVRYGTTVYTSAGVFNKEAEMRKCFHKMRDLVKPLIEYLNDYNTLVPEALQIDYRAKWMDDEDFWVNLVMAADIYDRITKVDEWFYGVYNRWNSLRKQRNEVIKTLTEKVQNDLA